MPIGLIAIAALAVIVLLIIVSNIHIVQQRRRWDPEAPAHQNR